MKKIALIGNPNSGKSSLFNQLTGLNQKVANFAGVTIDKKIGICQFPNQEKIEIIDFPGTYSLYPKSLDEQIVVDTLLNQHSEDKPDAIVLVLDASNPKRNLLIFNEIKDLGLPLILIFNMTDLAENAGVVYQKDLLEQEIPFPIIFANARTGEGIKELLNVLSKPRSEASQEFAFETPQIYEDLLSEIKEKYKLPNLYWALLYAHHYEKLSFLSESDKDFFQKITLKHKFRSLPTQADETLKRYNQIDFFLQKTATQTQAQKPISLISKKLDKILLHPVGGYLIFVGILLIIFNAIFTLAEYPMNWIETGITLLNQGIKAIFPAGMFVDLLTDGILAGIGGIVVFVPQIAILFAFLAILEETGYMARITIMSDRIMQKFGLSGKSIIPLMLGVACAIPAIMATRNIDSPKERLATILVTPLMSCSARLPIYTVIIGLVIPNTRLWGVFSLQGLVLFALYLLGLVMALLVAFVLKIILKSKGSSFFIMEMPTYKFPRWKNISVTIFEKCKIFVLDAGKVIMAISVILWGLANFAPAGRMEQAEKAVHTKYAHLPADEQQKYIASARLEASFAGILGKILEPAIRPLGYDWKIGIALISSFAAREVFVGTISTIYSIGSEEESTIQERMRAEINPNTGKKTFDLATGFSLLIFYAFAMQCMSTIAVVYRETKGWKYPLLQLVYMTALAYLLAMLTYQVLS